jgi:hypothetical protein
MVHRGVDVVDDGASLTPHPAMVVASTVSSALRATVPVLHACKMAENSTTKRGLLLVQCILAGGWCNTMTRLTRTCVSGDTTQLSVVCDYNLISLFNGSWSLNAGVLNAPTEKVRCVRLVHTDVHPHVLGADTAHIFHTASLRGDMES